MGYYDISDIAGIRDDQGTITCMECASDDQMAQLKEDDLLLNSEVDDPEKFIFCGTCKERITA